MAARTAGKNLRLLQEVHESLQKKMQEMFPTEASSSERDEAQEPLRKSEHLFRCGQGPGEDVSESTTARQGRNSVRGR